MRSPRAWRQVIRVGQNHIYTMYVRYFCKSFIKYTVMYSVYTQSWPTLQAIQCGARVKEAPCFNKLATILARDIHPMWECQTSCAARQLSWHRTKGRRRSSMQGNGALARKPHEYLTHGKTLDALMHHAVQKHTYLRGGCCAQTHPLTPPHTPTPIHPPTPTPIPIPTHTHT